jgi:hypothetical protein
MPYLSYIIAKVLALTDFFLEQWVDVTLITSSGNGCWSFQTVNASVNTCGAAFLINVTDVVEGVVALVPYLLGGLFASGTPSAT